jgi:hypothetical protein
MLMKNFEKYKSGVCKEELHYGIVLWVPISLKFCQHSLIKDISIKMLRFMHALATY